MAAQTTPYADIVSGIEALAGDALTTTEKARLKHLINRRARVAFRLHDSWPDFTTVKEQRLVRGDGGVEKDPTDFNGTATGENQVDTFLQFYDGEPFDDRSAWGYDHYDQIDSNGDDKSYPVGYTNQYDTANALEITSLTRASIALLINTSGAHGLKVGDKFKITGATYTTAPDPNIEHTVNSVGIPTNALTVDLTADGFAGFESMGVTDATFQQAKVWCSYKKRLTVTYGDGSGETTTVPRRWADYLIQATYADFLRADGQGEKATVEEALAQEVIDRELYMIDRQPNFLGHKVSMSTHTSKGNR